MLFHMKECRGCKKCLWIFSFSFLDHPFLLFYQGYYKKEVPKQKHYSTTKMNKLWLHSETAFDFNIQQRNHKTTKTIWINPKQWWMSGTYIKQCVNLKR